MANQDEIILLQEVKDKLTAGHRWLSAGYLEKVGVG